MEGLPCLLKEASQLHWPQVPGAPSHQNKIELPVELVVLHFCLFDLDDLLVVLLLNILCDLTGHRVSVEEVDLPIALQQHVSGHMTIATGHFDCPVEVELRKLCEEVLQVIVGDGIRPVHELVLLRTRKWRNSVIQPKLCNPVQCLPLLLGSECRTSLISLTVPLLIAIYGRETQQVFLQIALSGPVSRLRSFHISASSIVILRVI